MQLELAQAVDVADLAKARRAAATLRPLLDARSSDGAALVVASGSERVDVAPELMLSILRVVEAVAGPPGGTTENDAELSPQDAAQILRMSRPSVMRLIDRGLLHARMVGSHHRLSHTEVLAYRTQQASSRRGALANLVQMTEEDGI
jgi:excisionase family DNA binding protein